MSKIRFIVALAVVFATTILSGIMYGNLKRRWGPLESERIAAAKLADFPKTIGTWETLAEMDLDETSVRFLRPSGYRMCVLESSESNIPVSMTLLLGPPGNIGAHTPEVCVSGTGYQQLGPAERIFISYADNPQLKASFWVATFRSNGYDRHFLREYWAWSTGGPWEASEGSRIGYGLFPYLYKVQFGCRLPADFDPAASDSMPDFLRQFCIESADYLVSPVEARDAHETIVARTLRRISGAWK